MTPQTEILSTTTPQKTDCGWAIEMPQEIAKSFGVPSGLIVTLYPRHGNISAQMDLTMQTSEARGREPGWFIGMPQEMAKIVGVAEDSFIGIYAKAGSLYVEIIPPLEPELQTIADEILENNKGFYEEMKRLGD